VHTAATLSQGPRPDIVDATRHPSAVLAVRTISQFALGKPKSNRTALPAEESLIDM
jgi:hypothetical protein